MNYPSPSVSEVTAAADVINVSGGLTLINPAACGIKGDAIEKPCDVLNNPNGIEGDAIEKP